MWSLPKNDGDFARFFAVFLLSVAADASSCAGSPVVGFCSWESGSDDGEGEEEGAEDGVEEERSFSKGALPVAALAEAARASPLRISVVSGEVDRARTQGAAWHSGQDGSGSVAVVGGAKVEGFAPSAASQEAGGERGASARREAAPAAVAAAAAAAKERALGAG